MCNLNQNPAQVAAGSTPPFLQSVDGSGGPSAAPPMPTPTMAPPGAPMDTTAAPVTADVAPPDPTQLSTANPLATVNPGKDSSFLDKHTKIGKLVRTLAPFAPLLEGGLIGAAGSDGRPGSAFAASNNFFQQQNAMKMRTQMNALTQALDIARTQHIINQPNFPNSRPTPAIGPNGPTLLRPNPITGVMEPIPGGYAPVPPRTPAGPQPRIISNPDGSFTVDSKGVATPITMPAKAPPTPDDAGMESDTGDAPQASGAPVPIAPPRSQQANKTSKPEKEETRDASGKSKTQYRDMNPNSPTYNQVVDTPNAATRAPLPQRTPAAKPGSVAPELDARSPVFKQNAARLADGYLSRNGNDPDKAIAAMNNDPEAVAVYKDPVAKLIRDRAKPGKPAAKNSGSAYWQSLLDKANAKAGNSQPPPTPEDR